MSNTDILLALIAGALFIEMIFDKDNFEESWGQTFLIFIIAGAIMLGIAWGASTLLGMGGITL